MKEDSSFQGRKITLSQVRKSIAGRLSKSKFSAPHYYVKMAVQMDTLLNERKRLNTGREVPISLNAFIMKLTASAIERHPIINSTWQEDSVQIFPDIDIALAVVQKEGLITPVVRNCGQKKIAAIDDELRDLNPRAREGRLKPEEFSRAGFTISNLGAFGVEEFTAIINLPGSAILAVAAIQEEPVAEHGSIVIRKILRLTLSCDHRVIDGAVAADFLKTMKEMMEHPLSAII